MSCNTGVAHGSLGLISFPFSGFQTILEEINIIKCTHSTLGREW